MVGDIIAYIIFGFLVGVIARFALPGRRHLGCITTILAGIAGSFIAGIIVRALTGNQSYKPGWIASILGAMLVVWLFTRSQRRQYY
ncbi:MAG: GlsB/YeaQ/YmgE family stress response membrane protein [Acidimicrobiia bacterium]|nr:GlsB/YeaQ/YmgE family stress response membrane protein [Acidimicrobiia bacterium]